MNRRSSVTFTPNRATVLTDDVTMPQRLRCAWSVFRGIAAVLFAVIASGSVYAADYWHATSAARDAYAIGFGYNHVLSLPELADDFRFATAGYLVERDDGGAVLYGRLESPTHPDLLFDLQLDLAVRIDPGDVGYPPTDSPNQGLLPSAYVGQGGPIDPLMWHYYATYTGQLTGVGDMNGATLSLARGGCAFQVGVGADNCNVIRGGFGQVHAVTVSQLLTGAPLQSDYDGEITVALTDEGFCSEDGIPDDFAVWPTNHAFIMLGGVGEDYVFTAPGQFMERADGTASLNGIIHRASDPAKGFMVQMDFSLRVDPGDVSYPPTGSPKKELASSAYVQNGGPVDTDTWHYYRMLNGKLTGMGDLAGAEVSMTLTGGALQVGYGANGKSVEYGASCWLLFHTVKQPTTGPQLPDEFGGDGNLTLDFECDSCAEKADANDFALYSGGFAVVLNPLGSDFVFEMPGVFRDFGDGTAFMGGVLVRESDANAIFQFELSLSDRVNPGEPGYPPVGSPKKEMKAAAYIENGGPVDTGTWIYYQTFSGKLTGMGKYAGAILNVKRYGPSFQVGLGANGKNFGYGGSGWLDITVVHQPNTGNPFPDTFLGDANTDILTDWTPSNTAEIADYGVACPGSDGFVPRLTVLGTPLKLHPMILRIDRALGGSMALLAVGQTGQLSLLPNDCYSNLGQPHLFYGPVMLSGAAPGTGEMAVPIVVPDVGPIQAYLEGYVLDAAAPGDVAITNGVRVIVP